MLSAIQPVLRQRMLDAMRMRGMARLERTRNSRVILLVHRKETMRLLSDAYRSGYAVLAATVLLTALAWLFVLLA